MRFNDATCAAAHDAANVPVLSLVSALCVGGLFGFIEPLVVTKVFLMYILFDGVWIAAYPKCVPSAAKVVVLHHVITGALLLHPLRRPDRAIETCKNGLVELNTLFLILRRRSARGGATHALWNKMYVATLVPIRFIWQPYLLVYFVGLTSRDAAWERAQVVGAQAFLVGFNVFLVSRRRRESGGESEVGKRKNS